MMKWPFIKRKKGLAGKMGVKGPKKSMKKEGSSPWSKGRKTKENVKNRRQDSSRRSFLDFRKPLGPEKPKLSPNRRKKLESEDVGKRAKEKFTWVRIRGILLSIGRLILTIIIAGATVWVGHAAYGHATTSKYFSVNDFSVRGLRRLGQPEILRTAGLSEETNIFQMDMEAIHRKLIDHQWVADASIRRRLPRTVEINISERRAVATVFFDVPYLVDDGGEVFKRWARGDPIPSPVLTGFAREDFIGDEGETSKLIRDAIDLSRRYWASGLEKRFSLSEIHKEEDYGFSLVLANDPVYVRFGRGPYRVKLKRLGVLLKKLQRDGKNPSIIYFDNEINPSRVTVKLKTQDNGNKELEKKNDEKNNMQKRVSKI